MLLGMMNDMHAVIAPLAIIGILKAVWPYVLLAFGFSLVIFVHELGHFDSNQWLAHTRDLVQRLRHRVGRGGRDCGRAPSACAWRWPPPAESVHG